MTANKYTFKPSHFEGIWHPFDRASDTRVPGFVKMKANAVGQPGRFVYTREIPRKSFGGKPVLHTFSAATVAELSEKLDQFFINGGEL